MIPAPSYSDIDAILNEDRFKVGRGYAQGIPLQHNVVPLQHNVVGFIFFDQSISRPEVSDFLANLSLLNKHSGQLIHFFLPGISLYGPNEGDHAIEIGVINSAPVYHNTNAFLSFKDEFEREMPQWKYDLGVELVMMDLVDIEGRRHLNFKSAIFLKVEELIELKIITRTTDLFTQLIRFRSESKLKTAMDTKLALQSQFGVNWLKALILAMFPKAIQDLARAQAVLGGGSAIPK